MGEADQAEQRPTPYQRFETLARKIVTVPKSEIEEKRREREQPKTRKKKPRPA